MAEDINENESEDGDEEQQTGGKKKIIIFAAIGILILGAAIGGSMFFMSSGDLPESEDVEQIVESEPKQESISEAAIYHDLHPAFVANFAGNSKKKYMQVYIVALAKEQSVVDDLKLHMPAVRNNILMTLSNKTSNEVATVEGKEELRKEVLTTVRKTMMEKTGEEGIEDLYFTKFVAQ